jgi:hypothetical protein
MIKKLKNPIFLGLSILVCLSIFIFVLFKPELADNLTSEKNIKSSQQLTKLDAKRKLPERLIPLILETTGRNIADYKIRKDTDGNYKASSKRHKLTTTFTPDGINIEPILDKHSSWHVGLKFKGLGYEGNISQLSKPYITASANEIKYERGEITEWYINKPFGLEQGFTVYSPPSENTLNKNLVIEIEYESDLNPELKPNKKEILWKNKNQNIKFNYSKLLAYDSDRKVLPSYMSVSDNLISISIDENNAIYPITIDPIMIQETLIHTAFDPDVLAKYGQSVAIDNDVAVVGSPGDNDNGDLSGSAYVHLKDQGGPNNWGELKKISPLDASACKIFGFSVDASGDVIAVGANTITTTSACPTAEGAVYLFARNQGGADNWGQIKKLVASDGSAGNQFGFSATIDGDTVIVGAPGDNGGTGSAYVYQKDHDGVVDSWGEVTKITASDGSVDDIFGLTTAISADTAIIGAPAHIGGGVAISGAAYIFERNQPGANNWGEVTKITASDAAEGDVFGIAVSIDVDTVAVGAGADDIGSATDAGSVYFFGRDQGGANNWGEVTKLTASDADDFDALGSAVTIQLDLMFVGSPGDDDGGNGSGAFYGSEKNGSWGALEKFTASDAGPGSGVLKGLGVFEVDGPTGNRIIVSDNSTGSGNLLLEPEGIAVYIPDPLDDPAVEHYLIADKGIPAIISVDPTTGNQIIYEDNSGNPSIPFFLPIDLDFDSTEDFLYVTDPGGPRVIEINTTNRNRSIVNNTGDYPALGFPFGIVVDSDGNVVVTDLQLIISDGVVDLDFCGECIFGEYHPDCPDCAFVPNPCQPQTCEADAIVSPAIARINSTSGDVSLIADTSTCIGGRPFNRPLGIDIMANNNFAVVAIDLNESTAVIEDWAILEVNSTTGACSIIADATTITPGTGGTGPDLLFPEGIATLQSGELAVVDNFRDEVIVIDPATGDRTVLSGNAIGNGPQFEEPFWIAIKENGNSVVTDQGTTGINFGSSIDISGRTVIIGAPGKTNLEGGIYIFQFCEKASPAMSVSPADQTGLSGDTLNYTVTVQNTNNLACASTSFTMGATVPDGWTSNFSPSSLNLNSGQSTDVTWEVTSETGAPETNYEITAQATDDAEQIFTGSDNANYEVDNSAPVCDYDGTCDPGGEICGTCPDCISGPTCGNGLCEVADGENCNTCPADCNSKTNGKPSRQFCCGDGGVDCGSNQCNNETYSCTEVIPAPSYCCGDNVCEGAEDSSSCLVDCPDPVCGNGIKEQGEECDDLDFGVATCGDFSCSGGTLTCSVSCTLDSLSCTGCPLCNNNGMCDPGEDCNSCSNECSGKQNGKPSGRYCCGDGTPQSAEGNGSICDDNF